MKRSIEELVGNYGFSEMDIKEFRLTAGGNVTRHPWEVARLVVVSQFVKKCLPKNRHDESVVLDIGCGDAFVTGQLAMSLPEVKFVGIDHELDGPTRVALEKRRCVENLEMVRSLNEMSLGDRSVGVVLLLDVLEHIENEVVFLHQVICARTLDDAVFIITVPAFQCLFTSRDRFLGHFRRYNLGQLLNLGCQAGLYPVECGYFFTCLLVPRMIQVLFEKIGFVRERSKTSVSVWKGPELLNSSFETVLLWDFKISQILKRFRLRVPGLSCYMIGQKRAS